MSELQEFEGKMKKAQEFLVSQFESVRAGRANAAVLKGISVDYYGTPTPINQVGSISNPDPRTLVITPWDSSVLKGIEKAIQSSDVGINPQNDGRVIRLVFPQLTEERRKELGKQIKKTCEDTKVVLRNERRDMIEALKRLKKDNVITEDEQASIEKDVQKTLDRFIDEAEKVLKAKEAEILEV